MTQKVLKVGSSAAVTIPKESLKELGLKIGDLVNVYIVGQRLVVSKKKLSNISLLQDEEREILNFAKNFIERYRPALEALAKK